MTRRRLQRPLPRSLVFVGLMGAGKSAIGRRTAHRLELPFVDSDGEIEAAAGMSIADIFETYGEAEFRALERRVLARLLTDSVQVISTGGGAFMDPRTRDVIRDRGLSVWLRADLDTLVERTGRRDTRPLLRDKDPRQVLQDLMDQRYPVYETATLRVDSAEGPPEATVDRVIEALNNHQSAHLIPPPIVRDIDPADETSRLV